jgi:hypothetical protein
MAETKAQKIKSDKETIIDMEPVKEVSNKKNFKNPSFIISIITLILTVTMFSWIIFFYIPKLSKTEINRVDIIIEEIKKNNQENNKLNTLTKEIKKIKNQILDISKNKDEITQTEFKNLYSLVMSLKGDIKLITKKQINLEINNKVLDDQKDNDLKLKKNDNLSTKKKSSLDVSYLKKKEARLILEIQIIIDKLLAREDLGFTSNGQIGLYELGYFSRLKNYLAGFFKLRQYSNNSTPRAIITKAETELKNGNLYKCLNLLKTLPDNWKKSIDEFIINTEIHLNKKNKVTE